MAITIIVTICLLLLLAYVFEISAPKTRIPSVILLLILGWGVKQGATLFKVSIPDLTPILPILGTVGLVLIVLDGALELELNKSKLPMIRKSTIMALFPILLMSLGLAYAFSGVEHIPLRIGLINAIPLAIISSAIAIPSARGLLNHDKEFVTYESSLSDILGVVLFNFLLLNNGLSAESLGVFLLQLVLMIAVSFMSTLGLAFLLTKINHPIKFTPIILLVILIYAISKIYHLPSLIFILIFGLFVGNLDEIKRFAFINKLQPEILNIEVQKFKEITTEITFLIRALFFLLFGFLIKTNEILNPDTIVWAIAITISIFLIRFLFLKILRLQALPLLFIAPRGLITILLFLSIPVNESLGIVNNSLIIQVIILSALIMMFGLLRNTTDETTIEKNTASQSL